MSNCNQNKFCQHCVSVLQKTRLLNAGSANVAFGIRCRQPILAILVYIDTQIGLLDEEGNYVIIYGDPPPPQFLNCLVVVSWEPLSFSECTVNRGSTPKYCGCVFFENLSAALSNKGESLKFCNHSFYQIYILNPSFVKLVSISELYRYHVTRELSKKNLIVRSKQRDEGNDLVNFKGIVVIVGAMIKPTDGNSFCFIKLKDTQDSACITLLLQDSSLQWRCFMVAGDEVLVTAVQRKPIQIELEEQTSRCHGLRCFVYITSSTTIMKRLRRGVGPSGVQFQSKVNTFPVLLAPQADSSVIHFTGVITGVTYQGDTTGSTHDIALKNTVIKLDHEGLLLFLLRWPGLTEAAVGWLQAGTLVRMRHLHPVYLWGRLRGFAACSITEIIPLSLQAATNSSSSSSSSLRIMHAMRKSLQSKEPVECAATLAWCLLIKRDLKLKFCSSQGDHSNTEGEFGQIFALVKAWCRDATRKTRYRLFKIPNEFIDHSQCCACYGCEHSMSRSLSNQTLKPDTEFEYPNPNCASPRGGWDSEAQVSREYHVESSCRLDSHHRWPKVPTLAALRKHARVKRGGWEEKINDLLMRHSSTTTNRANQHKFTLSGQSWRVAFWNNSLGYDDEEANIVEQSEASGDGWECVQLIGKFSRFISPGSFYLRDCTSVLPTMLTRCSQDELLHEDDGAGDDEAGGYSVDQTISKFAAATQVVSKMSDPKVKSESTTGSLLVLSKFRMVSEVMHLGPDLSSCFDDDDDDDDHHHHHHHRNKRLKLEGADNEEQPLRVSLGGHLFLVSDMILADVRSTRWLDEMDHELPALALSPSKPIPFDPVIPSAVEISEPTMHSLLLTVLSKRVCSSFGCPQVVLFCRLVHSPRTIEVLFPMASSVLHHAVIPGALIVVINSVLERGPIPTPTLRFVAGTDNTMKIEVLAVPSQLTNFKHKDAFQSDWRSLPSAPPLATYLASATTVPTMALDVAPTTQFLKPDPNNITTQQLTSLRQRMLLPRPYGVLKLLCRVVFLNNVAVSPVTCDLCGRGAHVNYIGKACASVHCAGVVTMRASWAVKCTVDDGSAQALVQLYGRAAEKLLRLPPHLQLNCELHASKIVTKFVISEFTTKRCDKGPRAFRHGDEVVSALQKVCNSPVSLFSVVAGDRYVPPTSQSSPALPGAASMRVDRGLESGWTCLSCSNRNFPSRIVCKKCGVNMPSGMKRSKGKEGHQDVKSLELSNSELNMGGIKWTTSTLPRLQLSCFDVDHFDVQLEASKLCSHLTSSALTAAVDR